MQKRVIAITEWLDCFSRATAIERRDRTGIALRAGGGLAILQPHLHCSVVRLDPPCVILSKRSCVIRSFIASRGVEEPAACSSRHRQSSSKFQDPASSGNVIRPT